MKIKSTKVHSEEENYRIEQDYFYTGDDYWDWSIWVESSDSGLDKIDHVVYNLHYTFRKPVIIVNSRDNKFKMETSGWGTFTIYVQIVFKDETTLNLEHELVLTYPDDE